MKLSDYRTSAHEFTKSLSEINRNLAFAGIAIIWIFKSNESSIPHIDSKFLTPLLLITISLAFDIFQYLYSSIIWTWFHKSKENKGVQDDDEIDAPSWYPIPSYILFYSKVILNLSGFIFLLVLLHGELFQKISANCP
jgi:hypothetical protein